MSRWVALLAVTLALTACAGTSPPDPYSYSAAEQQHQEALREHGHAPELREKEKALCDRAGGDWMFGMDCNIVYTHGSPHGWAPYSRTYQVRFDPNGDPVGARNGCPSDFWHPDTRICEDH